MGRVDGEGKTIDGTWNVDWLVGSFDMEREKFDVEELEEEIEQEIAEPVALR